MGDMADDWGENGPPSFSMTAYLMGEYERKHMANNYKIISVKSQAKDWDSKYGPMKTWLIALEGVGEPVQLNQKADTAAPQVGDELYGTIEETQYGNKFKKERQQGFSKGNYQPRDDAAIRAQWAIGQAVQLWTNALAANNGETGGTDGGAFIEEHAAKFYAMVDRVKSSNASITPVEPPKKPARDWASVGKASPSQEEVDSLVASAVGNLDDFNDEPINLEDVPF